MGNEPWDNPEASFRAFVWKVFRISPFDFCLLVNPVSFIRVQGTTPRTEDDPRALNKESK